MWLASLKKFDNYIYLFIIVWNAISFNPNNNDNFDNDIERSKRSEEFNEEIGLMKNYNEDLFANNVINEQEFNEYSSLLDEYRDCRYNNFEARNKLSSNAYFKLKNCDTIDLFLLRDQLVRLRHFQKKLLRQMILNRVESFVEISNQTQRKSADSLREQNTTLAKENSQLQAALGNMTNTHLNDQDPNNATKLISDIEELQHLLSDFTIVQGYEYEINEEKAIELFSSMRVQLDFSNPKAQLILGGCLQQCILQQILAEADSYFKKYNDVNEIRNSDETIEIDILCTTKRLIESVNHLNEKRPGKDNITQITPTKVRQQMYAVLGCRGFSNDDHPLIVDIAEKIRLAMSEYRQIVDEDILNETDDQSIQITREVINMFCFRLKTQQVVPIYHFFKSGDEIDARLMEGSWCSEDAKKLEVEVCYFPCIEIRDDDGPSNQRIFTKAQVYTRQKKSFH